MKKIGIITLNGYFNYGNRLQNYALQELLESKGFKTETILIKNQKTIRGNKIIGFIKRILIKLKKTLKKVVNFKENKIIMNRTQQFKSFSKNYIRETRNYFVKNEIPVNEYEYFVSGSDQVWNPSYNGQSSVYFLDFAPTHKRISYAASFGISELPKEIIPSYKKLISNMSSLSVREGSGVKIIRELTGREAEVVLDPTFMLSKDKWISTAKESLKKPKQKYLLTYFLGNVSPSKKEKIELISREKNLEIVQLADIGDESRYIEGPSEFLDYINSADVILTDSFHGCVFSILFEKPFMVFDREGSKKSMISRIDTLLETFKLENRKSENIASIKDVYNVDYSHVSSILDVERKKSNSFLDIALNIKND